MPASLGRSRPSLTGDVTRTWVKRLPRIWVAMFLCALALHICTLRSFPLIRPVDEPGLLAMAYSYPQIQRLETPIFWGQLLTHPREPRSYLLMIGWLQLTGIHWVTGRILFLFVAIATLAALNLLGRRLFGKAGGLYAATFASLMLIFFVTGHQIRLDIVFALAVVLILLVYTYADSRNDPRLHFLVGFMLILSYEAHANALTLIFAFGVFYVFRYGITILKRRSFAPLAIIPGALVGIAVFALIHIAPSVDEFRQSFSFSLGERGIPLIDLLSGKLQGDISVNFQGALSMYQQDAPVEVILTILLLVFGALNKKTRWLVILYLLMTVGGGILLLGVYRPVYFVNSAPIIALIAAGLFVSHERRHGALALAYRGIATLMLIALAVSTVVQILPTALEDWNNRIVAQNEQLRSEIPANATVISSPLALLGLGFDRHVLDVGLYTQLARLTSWDAVIRQTLPEFLVYYLQDIPQFHPAEYGGASLTPIDLPIEALEIDRTQLNGNVSTIEVIRLAPAP